MVHISLKYLQYFALIDFPAKSLICLKNIDLNHKFVNIYFNKNINRTELA